MCHGSLRMIYRTQFEQWVPAAIDKVFLFFANPNNLPPVMPSESGTELGALRLVTPPNLARIALAAGSWLAGMGSEIVTSFRLFSFLPFRAQWIA
jgi:hypothetical protein